MTLSAECKCHVVFSPSASGTLKMALQASGQADEVLCPFDDFSFGPLASDTPANRTQWVENALGCTGWEYVTDRTSAFLASLEATTSPLTAWLSRTDARSYAGFLWFLSRVGDRSLTVIDVPGIAATGGDHLLMLIDRASQLTLKQRTEFEVEWDILLREDAALRVIEDERLVSAPIEYFDSLLLSHADVEWQKMARIVGGVLGDFSDNGIHQTGDLVLGARLADLAEAGRLEWRGDLSQMRHCELRLPAATQVKL